MIMKCTLCTFRNILKGTDVTVAFGPSALEMLGVPLDSKFDTLIQVKTDTSAKWYFLYKEVKCGLGSLPSTPAQIKLLDDNSRDGYKNLYRGKFGIHDNMIKGFKAQSDTDRWFGNIEKDIDHFPIARREL
jgi:hypothetical protein